MLKGKKFNAFALEDIAPKTAHQLLCGCTSTVVHMSPSCYACVFQLMCVLFLQEANYLYHFSSIIQSSILPRAESKLIPTFTIGFPQSAKRWA